MTKRIIDILNEKISLRVYFFNNQYGLYLIPVPYIKIRAGLKSWVFALIFLRWEFVVDFIKWRKK